PLRSVTYTSIVGTLFLAAPAFLEGGFGFLGYSLSEWAMIFYLGFFGTVLGGIGLRRRKWLMITIFSLAIVGLVSSCGGGGGGAPASEGDPAPASEVDPAPANKSSISVSDLESGKTYYWKVVTNNGTHTIESAVQSFTTR
ncbi:MAG: hypothetical protein ACERLB_13980, partial [Gammaproteobacteria bacterium]